MQGIFDYLINVIYAGLPIFTTLMMVYWILSLIWLIHKPAKKNRINMRGLWGICVKRNTTKTECEFTKR